MRTLKFLIFLLSSCLQIPSAQAAQQFKKFPLNRYDPSLILSSLVSQCQKNQETCPASVAKIVMIMNEINESLAVLEGKPEPELMALIEILSNELSFCKDAECIIDFERRNYHNFRLAVSKAKHFYHGGPEYEKAMEQVMIRMTDYIEKVNEL
ncbi:unnamed protein product [Caenorhabditis brenneri]